MCGVEDVEKGMLTFRECVESVLRGKVALFREKAPKKLLVKNQLYGIEPLQTTYFKIFSDSRRCRENIECNPFSAGKV